MVRSFVFFMFLMLFGCADVKLDQNSRTSSDNSATKKLPKQVTYVVMWDGENIITPEGEFFGTDQFETFVSQLSNKIRNNVVLRSSQRNAYDSSSLVAAQLESLGVRNVVRMFAKTDQPKKASKGRVVKIMLSKSGVVTFENHNYSFSEDEELFRELASMGVGKVILVIEGEEMFDEARGLLDMLNEKNIGQANVIASLRSK